MLGGMQDWPLRIMRISTMRRESTETRELVSLYADGNIVRTTGPGSPATPRGWRRRSSGSG